MAEEEQGQGQKKKSSMVDKAQDIKKAADNAKKVKDMAEKAKMLKGASALGPLMTIIGYALLVILIIIIVVGIIMFFATMPGIILGKLKALAAGFFEWCLGKAVGTENVVNIMDIAETADYIETMGYDLKGYGFVTEDKTESDVKDTERRGSSSDQPTKLDKNMGILRFEDDVVANIYSKPIRNFLVSNNYVYTIRNQNVSFKSAWENSSLFENILSFVWPWGRLAEVLFGGNPRKGTGLIGIYGDSGVIGGARDSNGIPTGGVSFTTSFNIDLDSKTLDIKRGWFTNKSKSYNLDGWTGRYGMPLEFLLSVHVATLAPDLAIEMYENFDTEIIMLLRKIDNTEMMAGYKNNNGDMIDFKSLMNAAYNNDNRNVLDYIVNWFQDVFDNDRTLTGLFEGGLDHADDCNCCEHVPNARASGGSYGPCNNFSGYVQEGEAEVPATSTTAAQPAQPAKLIVGPTVAKKRWTNTRFNLDDLQSKLRTFGINITNGAREALEAIGNTVTTSDGDSTAGPSNHTWTFDGKTFTFIISASKTQGTCYYSLEIILPDEFSPLVDSISSDSCEGQIGEACSTYIKAIKSAMEAVNAYDFDTYTPYIGDVRNHWFRDVYFVADLNTQIILTDEEYERETKERWSLFEVYTTDSSLANEKGYRLVPSNSPISAEELDGEYVLLYAANGEYIDENGETQSYQMYNNGNRVEFLPASEYAKEIGISEYAKEFEIAVEKMVVTDTLGDARPSAEGNRNSLGQWSAYKLIPGSEGEWEQIAVNENSPSALKDFENVDRIYVKETVASDDITQIEDGVRGPTNPIIKRMFLEDKYFVYDGSVKKADMIMKVKEKYAGTATDFDNKSNSEKQNIIKDVEKDTYVFEKETDSDGIVKIKSIKETYTETTPGNPPQVAQEYYNDPNIYEITLGSNLVGKIALSKDSLGAFSMLENMNSLDSDYIYRDFKELIVELDYFDKEDLTAPNPEVFEWILPDSGSAGWPLRKYDKNENYYGTLLHSKDDYDIKNDKVIQEAAKIMSQTPDENGELNEVIVPTTAPQEPTGSDPSTTTTIRSKGTVRKLLDEMERIHTIMEEELYEYCVYIGSDDTVQKHWKPECSNYDNCQIKNHCNHADRPGCNLAWPFESSRNPRT